MGSDTTIGVSEETRRALGKVRRKEESSLDETIMRLIAENSDGKNCPDCGSPMKVAHARPFNLFVFDLECTNPKCDYATEYEALKGIQK